MAITTYDGIVHTQDESANGLVRCRGATFRPPDARRITPWDVTLIAQWSPDGSRIAFDMSRSDGPHDLFVVHPDGRAHAGHLIQDGVFSFGPVWSSDSTELLIVRGPDGVDDIDLWTVNVDGTGLLQVTSQPGEYAGYG